MYVRKQYMNLGYLLVFNIEKVNANPVIAEVLMQWKFNQRCTVYSTWNYETHSTPKNLDCDIQKGKAPNRQRLNAFWALTYDTTSRHHLNHVTLIERQTTIYHKWNEPKVNPSNLCFKLINCQLECRRVSSVHWNKIHHLKILSCRLQAIDILWVWMALSLPMRIQIEQKNKQQIKTKEFMKR